MSQAAPGPIACYAGDKSDESPMALLRRVIGAAVRLQAAPEADLRAGMYQALAIVDELERERRASCRKWRFAPAQEPNCWHVGPVGEERPVPGTSVGLVAAWMAISGELPVCADLVEPGALHPDRIIRRALRDTAVKWAEQAGCRPLADAFRRIQIHQGRLHYPKRPGDPQIVTAHVPFVSATPLAQQPRATMRHLQFG